MCCLLTKPKYLDFSFPELASLAGLEGVELGEMLGRYRDQIEGWEEVKIREEFAQRCRENPCVYVTLPSVETAVCILKRSICIEKFVSVYATGPSIESLLEQLPSNSAFLSLITNPANSFAFSVDFFQDTVSYESKVQLIERFDPLPFAGKVDTVNPTLRCWVIRDVSLQFSFGLEAASLKEGPRFCSKYRLSKREYLGPTSTDNDLAFLMVNEARVTEKSMVLDPFVGTGSILVAAQHFGALCFGSDIDMRVLKGLKVGKSRIGREADIFTNFTNYGLQLPDILSCDNSKPAWGLPSIFDAIICDPPYGVRARSRTAGNKTMPTQSFIPDTNQYESKQLVEDLLTLAARLLVLGGRLVFLLPTDRLTYNSASLPRNPLLKLVSNSENVLSHKTARRLLTWERVAEVQSGESEQGHCFYAAPRSVWRS